MANLTREDLELTVIDHEILLSQTARRGAKVSADASGERQVRYWDMCDIDFLIFDRLTSASGDLFISMRAENDYAHSLI